MNAATLKALRGSIKKWRGILAGKVKDRGASNCPLCRRFNTVCGCAGCPVAELTGDDYCEGTPYEQWSNSNCNGGAADTPARKRMARAELNFLSSLLPKKRGATTKRNNNE